MEKQIYFYNNEGEKLVGTLHLPDEGSSEKGVIMGHCFTCSRHTHILIQICKTLAQAGWMGLRFDFSGNGQSEGDFFKSNYSKHIAEMKQAIAFMSNQGVSWIGLSGHSMGAAIAVLTAAQGREVSSLHSLAKRGNEIEEVNVKAVCGLAGRLSGLDPIRLFNELQQKELERTGQISFVSRGRSLKLSKEFFLDARQYDLEQSIRSLKIPLLIVHGDQDEIISVNEAYKAHRFNPNNTSISIIPGADHLFSQNIHREQIVEQLRDWFKQQYEQKSNP